MYLWLWPVLPRRGSCPLSIFSSQPLFRSRILAVRPPWPKRSSENRGSGPLWRLVFLLAPGDGEEGDVSKFRRGVRRSSFSLCLGNQPKGVGFQSGVVFQHASPRFALTAALRMRRRDLDSRLNMSRRVRCDRSPVRPSPIGCAHAVGHLYEYLRVSVPCRVAGNKSPCADCPSPPHTPALVMQIPWSGGKRFFTSVF